MESFHNISTRYVLYNIEVFLSQIDVKLLNSQDRKDLEDQKRKLVGEYLNKEEYLKTIGFNSEEELIDYWNKKIKLIVI